MHFCQRPERRRTTRKHFCQPSELRRRLAASPFEPFLSVHMESNGWKVESDATAPHLVAKVGLFCT